MLRNKGIQIQVCRDPNAKYAIVERSDRTIRDKLYKYMTYKNTYKYIDVLPRFFRGYNEAVHSATVMAPSKVTDSDILAIWNRMRSKHSAISRASVTFSVGQHVRISKQKLKFAKGGEQNYTTELFKVKACAGIQAPSTNYRIC